MADDPLTSTGKIAGYAYPPDLSRHVIQRWASVPAAVPHATVPEFATLKHFLSACYQASLMREEERPVTFRAILASPELFPPDGMPPESLQRLARRSQNETSHRVIPLNASAVAAEARMLERADLLGHTEPEHYLWPACQWGRFDATKPMLKWDTAWRALRDEAGLHGLRFQRSAAHGHHRSWPRWA